MRLRVVAEVPVAMLPRLADLLGAGAVVEVSLLADARPAQSNESLFASFSSEKEGACLPSSLPAPQKRKPGPPKGRSGAPPWRTPEREAQLRADWGTVLPPAERLARLEAHPGPPVPVWPGNLRFWGEQLGLGPMAAPAGAARVAAATAGRLAGSWRTEARRAVLARMWPTYASTPEVRAALDAIDVDRPVPEAADLSIWAHQLGLKRPEGFRRKRPDVAGGNQARGVEAARERVAADVCAPAPWVPPAPVAAVSVSSIGRGAIPALPAAGDDGVIRASFGEVRAWALFFGIRYDGTNMDQVNRRRAGMRLPPVTQCERRTAAERGEAA
jgi:hypothetical protein